MPRPKVLSVLRADSPAPGSLAPERSSPRHPRRGRSSLCFPLEPMNVAWLLNARLNRKDPPFARHSWRSAANSALLRAFRGCGPCSLRVHASILPRHRLRTLDRGRTRRVRRSCCQKMRARPGRAERARHRTAGGCVACPAPSTVSAIETRRASWHWCAGKGSRSLPDSKPTQFQLGATYDREFPPEGKRRSNFVRV